MKASITFLLFAFALSAIAARGTAEFSVLTENGDVTQITCGEYFSDQLPAPTYDPPEVLWHFTEPAGFQQKIATIGLSGSYVLTGGWYGGARMFQGYSGDGSVIWNYEPSGSWSSLATTTASAQDSDVFYAVQNWDDAKGARTAIYCFQGDSGTPVWSWDCSGIFDSGSCDGPGRAACSNDGTVLAVGGAMNGHLAVNFFCPDSAGPYATFEDSSLAYYPRQVRITADGSKCIFRCSATLYRVDTATGALEATYDLGSSTDCFGVSPDGSVVAYGFTAARIAVWDGADYQLEAAIGVPGYYGGAAAAAGDNSTVYFGFYKNNYTTNRIIRYDLNTSSTQWIYDYPVGSGGYQDVVEWMDCSSDGRWMVTASWGCETGGGAEVNVFDDLYHDEPVCSIDTPGSMFHADITDDGRYVSAAGKHVHANEMGSGSDVYMAEIDILGLSTETSPPSGLDIYPNPSAGSFSASYRVPDSGTVSLEVYDQSGRLVHRQNLTESGTAEVNADLPSGVYTCRISGQEGSESARLVVLGD